MAQKFLTPIDLNGNEVRNAVAQNLASAPGTPSKGQFYYDTSTNILYWYNGTSWIPSTGGTPTGTAGGDLTGTYPNPTIAAGAVTGTKINTSSVASAILLTGTLASRPGATGNSGLFYFATDSNGGTLFQSNGTAWVQVALGVTQSTTPNGSAGGDLTGTYPNPTIAGNAVTGAKVNASSVGTVLLLTGTAASRPSPSAANSGLYYFATDTNGGTLYQSTGAAWTQLTRGLNEVELLANKNAASGYAGLNSSSKVAVTYIDTTGVATTVLLTGTLAARPAAAATNNGYYYFATDSNGGTLYQSTGAAWTQITRGLTEVELLANKNAANGYAGLNGSSQVALAQLPVAASGVNSSTLIVRADDSRLSDSRTPTAGSVVDASVSASAAIAFSKIAAPTAATTWNSQKITNLADPTNAQDAATKNYVDSQSAGLDFKASVRVATTSALPANTATTTTLTANANGALAIDGYSPVAGERVLVKNEATAANNGIYVVTNAGGASATWVLTRASDANTTSNLSAGALVYVEQGTVNAGQQWVLSTTGAITIGTTAQTWTQFSGASTATAGNGLTASGNVFSVGAGTGITVGADTVSIDTSVVARKATGLIGTGAATSIAFTHNLGNQYVTAQLFDASTNALVNADITLTDANTVTFAFSVAPASNAYRVVVTG